MDQEWMPDGRSLLRLHDEATERWHAVQTADAHRVEADFGTVASQDVDGSFSTLILAEHRANFDLWHQEDEARDRTAPDARIAGVKHAIDALNQRRNDLVEAIDGSLSVRIPQAEDCSLHSETPAMIVDRLSIMALKIYHTREESTRDTASEAHRARNLERLGTLVEQRNDLAGCLDELLAQIARGERRFKVYRQMKMYNDPEMNPVLYRQARG